MHPIDKALQMLEHSTKHNLDTAGSKIKRLLQSFVFPIGIKL